jgi:hypothetical protein
MSDVRDQVSDLDDAKNWTAEMIAALQCVTREDGKKSHVFLDYGNRCQCGEVDLHAYRKVELR